jgi:septal ring factor EnvC (AmiA/AmiB activator)
MVFDPAVFLSVSRLLADVHPTADREACFRTALGRAYYAPLMTLAARVEEVQGRGSVPAARVHASIKSALSRTGARHFRQIRQRLEALEQLRSRADYELADFDIELTEVEAAIERAERLLQSIATAPDDLFKNLRL